MADKILQFAVSLEDAVSPGAKTASQALLQLQVNLGDTKEKAEKVEDPVRELRHSFKEASAGFREFASALAGGNVEGAIAGLTEGLAGMATALDLVVPGLGQAASMAIKMAGGMAGAFAEIAEEGVKTALEVTDVNERLTATFEALGSHEGAGKGTLQFLNDLATELPQSRDQLAQWTKQYEAMGVTDLGQLRAQIRATASAQAIGGDQAAAAYEKMQEKVRLAVEAHHGLKMAEKSLKALYSAGLNVTDIAARMNMSTQQLAAQLKAGTADAQAFGNAMTESALAKGVGPLEAMGNSISSIYQKGKETFEHLFDGIDTSPITEGLKDLISLGDQGKPSGKAMKDGIGAGIQGIINWMGEMLVEAQVLFLSMELYAVTHKKQLNQVEDAFKSIGHAIKAVVVGLETLFQMGSNPPAGFMKMMLTLSGLSLSGGAGGGDGSIEGGSKPKTEAPAHAEGGMVGKPAAGEYFASVAPGEMILPQRHVQEIFGGGVSAAAMSMPANSNSSSIHIDQLIIQAPNGVTDATAVTAAGLAIALERYQLASGR